MNMMRYSKAILFISSLLLLSCSKEINTVQTTEIDIAEEQKFGPEIVLGEKLNNPYSLSNMQAAYESLVRTKSGEGADVEELEANCLYVRFLPKDSTDVAILQSSNLELFDYPLDYDIEVEGDTYHDPSIPEGQITWHYTTVKPDFEFPNIEYEILEECYIPEETEDTKAGGSSFASELEMLAILNADLPEKYQPKAETKALGLGKKPSGTIRVENDNTYRLESIRGVKVRCHYLVNISSAYTDENGKYTIGNRYVCNPHYAIVYENTKDFVIWGNWAFVAAANHNLGYHSNSGYNADVIASDNEWRWAVINNAAYDFYKMCSSEGLKTPPSGLKIWCWPNADYSSAPMLHHLLGVNSGTISSSLALVLAPGLATAIIYSATLLISSGLPDITIGMTYDAPLAGGDVINVTPNSQYKYHYYDVWHELFHASHFSQAGESVWGPYINYIVTHGFGYGDGTAKESTGKNICELGESWAYANQYLESKNYYVGYWFDDSISSINYLMKSSLSRKQIYDCLTKNVKSIDDLKSKLISKYPSKSSSINAAF